MNDVTAGAALQPRPRSLDLLLRRWKLVAAVGLLVSAAGALVIAQWRPTFDAHSSLLVDPPQTAIPETDPKDSGAGPMIFSLKTQMQLLQGAELENSVASALHGAVTDPDGHLLTIEGHQVRLSIHAPSETEMIVITGSSEKPDLAAKAVNALATAYLNLVDEIGKEGLIKSQTSVAQHRSKAKKQMDAAQSTLESLKRTYHINDIAGAIQLADQNLSDLQTKRNAAAADLASSTARAEVLKKQFQDEPESLSNATIPAADPLVQAQEAKVEQLKSDLATKRTKLTPQHPDIIALSAQIHSEELRLEQLKKSSGDRGIVKNPNKRLLSQQYSDQESLVSAKRAELAKDNSSLAELQGRLQKYPDYELLFARQIALLKSATTDFERYQKVGADLDLHQQSMTAHVRIIDQATAPTVPAGPNHYVVLALVGLFGIVLGVAVALIRGPESVQVTTANDLNKFLALPPIAVVPMLGSGKSGEVVLPDAYPVVGWILLDTEIDRDGIIVAISSPNSPQDAQALVAAVAAAMAATDREVVIVSSSNLAPGTHALPGKRLGQSPGSSELASVDGWGSDEDGINVQNVRVVNLFLPVVGSEFFWGSVSFAHGIKKMRKPGRLVILDASSIRDDTSLSLVARECDETFLVLNGADVTVRDVNHASQTVFKGGKAAPRYVFMQQGKIPTSRKSNSNTLISENAKLILEFVLGKNGATKKD